LAVIAAFLGAGEPEALAQRVEQGRADVEREPMIATVDVQTYGGGITRIACRRLRRDVAGDQWCGGGCRRHGQEISSAITRRKLARAREIGFAAHRMLRRE
jgi:hypothetical protein